ncbi:MAG: metal ABC transporter solute-binding protein, Zn/Mn family, partial [Acidimicrobiales bacterium]
MKRTTWQIVLTTSLASSLLMVLAACGSGDSDDAATAVDAPAAATRERPTIVVTTNILGDVVGELLGDQADVVTIMPVGADPHDFQASAKEVDLLLQADALIVNGGGFEEGLLDVVESAVDQGVPTFEAIDAVDTIEFAVDAGHDQDEHEDEADGEHGDPGQDEEHEDEEHEGDDHDEHEGEGDDHEDAEHEGDDHDEHEGDDHEDEHGHDGMDPHFFTDPVRMGDAVRGIGAFLAAEVPDLDQASLDAAVDQYVTDLEALDAEIDELLAAIPPERRVLVTSHEVFGYFAHRYGFEVVGAVIPGGTTVESASAGELADLAELIEAEGV